ncbi:MAG: MlaD family protein [Betaproteobacteria bacterium]
MENDKRYFVAGLFIIILLVGTVLAFMWLAGSERRDDVMYHIKFGESVSGLAVGEAVKYRGVDVGTVKTMTLDTVDPRLVEVAVSLRKEAPVKTDTRAMLKMKGVTGAMFIELNGGSPKTDLLVASTKEGQIPEIGTEKSPLTNAMDQLPQVLQKFTAIEEQAKGVMTDVAGFTKKVKENPSLLLRKPSEQDLERAREREKEEEAAKAAAKRKTK